MKYGYQNGKIKEFKKLQINPYDLGYLRAYAVFDVARTTKEGKIFLLEEHYKRIQYSAKEVGLKITLSKKEYEETVYKLMKKNNVKRTIIRTVVSGGVSKDGFSTSGKGSVVILLEKFVLPKKENYEKGVNVISLAYNREIPNIKTTNYLRVIINQKNRLKKKAYETLYINNGKVYEASTANVFIVKNKKIYTPKYGILPGTTKTLLLKILQKNGIIVFEKNITERQLFNADEVFLTATNKNVLPVKKIDGKKVGNGAVGETTKELIKIYNNFESNY